ncbi:MAG TPA: hypothetical protein DCL13_02195, partial [Peptococcaceae bacterium]|nr:hypothetical protein [Peptococcaceae bacterium]
MPPKIIISGYYGFKNSGDEAMLYAIIDALRARIPGVELVVLSHRPRETAAEFGVRAVPRWSPFHLWRELGTADLLVSGGGGPPPPHPCPLTPPLYPGGEWEGGGVGKRGEIGGG